MKLLITGACGFIGSNAVKYFLDKNKQLGQTKYVIESVIDKCTYAANPMLMKDLNIPIQRLDISTVPWEYLLSTQRPDVIINFAAESAVDVSILDPTEFLESNYFGIFRLYSGLRVYNYKHPDKKTLLIQVSSDEVYGQIALDQNIEFHEFSPMRPNNPYSATKAAADLLLQAAYHTYHDFDYSICRACNNYGPNQHMEKFIPTVISSILKNEKIPIYGRGKNIREWLWVGDFIRGIEKVIDTYFADATKIVDNVFNFGSSYRLSNMHLVKLIIQTMKASEKLISFVPDRPGHDVKYAVNWNKAKDILDWKPEKDFIDGLNAVINDISCRVNKS